MSEFCNSVLCGKTSAMFGDTATTNDELEESARRSFLFETVSFEFFPPDDCSVGADFADPDGRGEADFTDVFSRRSRGDLDRDLDRGLD